NMRARKEILDAQSDELADGIDICAKALSASRVLITADKSSSKRAFALLASLSDKTFVKNASVRIIPSRYPMSAAPLIIKRAYKIEVDPSRGGLADGFAVIGAETALAVNHAVRENKPFCERIVTIAGKDITRSGNYKIRFGTPISHIIDELGLNSETIEGVILGGEMSGRFTSDYNTPVDKHIEALFFLSGDDNRRSGKYPCIRCGRCVDVCPMRLLPNELAHSVSTEAKSASLRKHCINCGCCSAVCPSGIPLARMMSSTGESNG
ncbi:MAG TPA: 4Fe-4S dicluster domain-containing protein, partial [Spirochaetota bacterium]|nr:4Fe-4S dicluster domain-containing protein [Spirochaetota bacterium]